MKKEIENGIEFEASLITPQTKSLHEIRIDILKETIITMRENLKVKDDTIAILNHHVQTLKDTINLIKNK